MSGFDPRAVRETYSAIAEDYVVTFGDDLAQLPINREMLGEVARRTAGRGPVLDVGCGPAQAGGYLAERGSAVVGVDPAPGMLTVARRRNPGPALLAGDMMRLPVAGGSCAGAVAFCVLHHVPRAELGAALGELRRALAPGAVLLVATHGGTGTFSAEGVGGIEITGTLYAEDELVAALAAAGFAVDAVRHREPLATERKGDRVYAMATAVA